MDTAPQKRIALRSSRWWAMKSMPSRMSATRLVRGRSTGARRSRFTNNRATADRANDAASMARVWPGPMVADNKPATAGPTM